jgi:SulP family sulfate permease
MTAIDATGLLAFEELAHKLHASGRSLIVCGARPQPAELLRQAKFEQQIGPQNICPNIQSALDRAEALFTAPRPARRSA